MIQNMSKTFEMVVKFQFSGKISIQINISFAVITSLALWKNRVNLLLQSF